MFHLEYHLTKYELKVHMLAGLKWRASFNMLRISTIVLLVSPADYCAPVWTQSALTYKLNNLLAKPLEPSVPAKETLISSFCQHW